MTCGGKQNLGPTDHKLHMESMQHNHWGRGRCTKFEEHHWEGAPLVEDQEKSSHKGSYAQSQGNGRR